MAGATASGFRSFFHALRPFFASFLMFLVAFGGFGAALIVITVFMFPLTGFGGFLHALIPFLAGFLIFLIALGGLGTPIVIAIPVMMVAIPIPVMTSAVII